MLRVLVSNAGDGSDYQPVTHKDSSSPKSVVCIAQPPKNPMACLASGPPEPTQPTNHLLHRHDPFIPFHLRKV